MKWTFNCFFVIQSGNYQFQLTNHLIGFNQFSIFATDLKKHQYETKSRRLRLQILIFFYVSS